MAKRPAAAPGPSDGPALHRNALLAAMPHQDQERLAPHIELVDLGFKAPLHQPGQPIEHVYFPLNCVVSVVSALEGEGPIEVSTIGPEGMVGLPAFLDVAASPQTTFCQVPGQAARLQVTALHQFFDAGPLHLLLLRYTQAVMTFLAQNAACNRLHNTDQRCARWLAQTHDRVTADTFPLTQEFLAQMLGVRRATVSLSAAAIQQAGLIRYSRGRITILDRPGLEAAACGCYRVIADEFAKISHQ
jgi:CRP-like cAMP-binding protein